MEEGYSNLPTIAESGDFESQASEKLEDPVAESTPLRHDFIREQEKPKIDRVALVGCIASCAAVILSVILVVSVSIGIEEADRDYNNIQLAQHIYEAWDVRYSPFLNDKLSIHYSIDPAPDNSSNAHYKATLYMFEGEPPPSVAYYTVQQRNVGISRVKGAVMYYWFNQGTTLNVSVCSDYNQNVDLYVLKGSDSYYQWNEHRKLNGNPINVEPSCSELNRITYPVTITDGSDEYVFIVLLKIRSEIASSSVTVTYSIASVVFNTSHSVLKCTADEYTPVCSLPLYNYYPVVQIEPSNNNNNNKNIASNGNFVLYDNKQKLNIMTRAEVYGGFIALVCVLSCVFLLLVVTVVCCVCCYCRIRRKKRSLVELDYIQIQ